MQCEVSCPRHNARPDRPWTMGFPGMRLVEKAPGLRWLGQPAARTPAEQPVTVAGDPAVGRIAAEARYHPQQRCRQPPASAETAQDAEDRIGIGVPVTFLYQQERDRIVSRQAVRQEQCAEIGRAHV